MSKEGRPPSAPTATPRWNETLIWPLKLPRLTGAAPTPKGSDAASAAAALGWNEGAVLRYYRQGELSVRILDHDRFCADKFMGEFRVLLGDLRAASSTEAASPMVVVNPRRRASRRCAPSS